MAFDLEDLTMSFGGFRSDPMAIDAESFFSLVDAGVEQGFRSGSMWAILLDPLAKAGHDARSVARGCADRGMQIRIVEALTEWTHGERAKIDAAARPLFEAARDLGAEEILTVSMDAGEIDLDDAIAGFGYACDLAAKYGLRLGIEFLPWSSIPDLATAWAIVRRSGRENGGLILDTWHWQRQPGGPDHQLLRSIPGDRIHVLQVNDVAAVPNGDLLTETMTNRLLPGEGVVDYAALVASLEFIEAEPIVAPEVFNTDLLALGDSELARQIGESTRRMLSV